MNIEQVKSEIKALVRPVHVAYRENREAMWYKYIADVDTHLKVAAMRYEAIHAMHPKPFKSLLDIGAGAGYTPYFFNAAGTEVYALDMPNIEFYTACLNALGLPKIVQHINPFVLLDVPRRFEAVTAFALTFDRYTKQPETLWGATEWEFFVDDILNNVLESPGFLYLEFVKPIAGAEPHVISRNVQTLLKTKYNAIIGFKSAVIRV